MNPETTTARTPARGIFSVSCLSLLALAALSRPAFGQIVPANDGTGTTVNQQGQNFEIDGGTVSGDGKNLFHSLESFNLSKDQIATFLANPGPLNILTRVTGGNASLINGLIRVTGGNPNLFIVNPAGIVFGPGARLNVPASFTATTATGIGFGNGLWFNATGSNNYRDLNGTPFQFAFDRANPGGIVNAGILSVPAGQNLNLIAGNVVNTGQLGGSNSNLTIAAVPGSQVVRLSLPGSPLSLEIEPPRDSSGLILPFRPVDLPVLLTTAGVTIPAVSNQTATVTFSGNGVNIQNATIVSDGGNISLTGTGANTAPGNQSGVRVNKSTLRTSGEGNIEVSGSIPSDDITSPAKRGNRGIIATDSTFSVENGNIILTGRGGGNRGGDNNVGIDWRRGALRATGTGSIALEGIAGPVASGSGGGHGVRLEGLTLSTVNGPIDIRGTASQNGSGILATGNTTTIEATGTGNIFLRGEIGFNGVGEGVVLSEARVTQTGTGIITLTANEIAVNERSSVGANRSVQVRSLDPALGITAGGTSKPPGENRDRDSRLNLDQAELDRITAGSLTIGRADGEGTVSIGTGGVTLSNPTIIRTPLGAIQADGPIAATNSITLQADRVNTTEISAPNITIAATDDITTGNLTARSTLGRGEIRLTSGQGGITAGAIVGSGLGGGFVLLQAKDDISVNSIEAAGNPLVSNDPIIDIGTDGFIRIKGFLGSDSRTSVSTAGGNSGPIRLDFDGTSFTVGDTTENGSAGAITDGKTTIPPTTVLQKNGLGGLILFRPGDNTGGGTDNGGNTGGGIDNGGNTGGGTDNGGNTGGGIDNGGNTGGGIDNGGNTGGGIDNGGNTGGEIDNGGNTGGGTDNGGITGGGIDNGGNTGGPVLPPLSFLPDLPSGESLLESPSFSLLYKFPELTALESLFTSANQFYRSNIGASFSTIALALSNRSPLYSATSTARAAIEDIERSVSGDFEDYLGLSDSSPVSLEEARKVLREMERITGVRSALIYLFFRPVAAVAGEEAGETLWTFDSRGRSGRISTAGRDSDRLELIVVTPSEVIRRPVDEATRSRVLAAVPELQGTITNPRRPRAYLEPSRQLYNWSIAPVEEDLQRNKIGNLLFIVDSGLRSLPFAALHDGREFLVQRYSIGLLPTLSLTDRDYASVRGQRVLAMGAERFTEQQPLPAVPVELSLIAGQLWKGVFFLNEGFTVNNLQRSRQAEGFRVIHLATHANFESGVLTRSYIQFWNERLTLDRLRQLNFGDPPVDLLVLSACRTALGDREAELGFAGAAALARVKTVLGSLWEVSDEGTLALMSGFYGVLSASPIKAEALRRAQLSMLAGEIRVEGGRLVTPEGNFPLPPVLAGLEDTKLNHPYYWSGFTIIGSPW